MVRCMYVCMCVCVYVCMIRCDKIRRGWSVTSKYDMLCYGESSAPGDLFSGLG